MLLSRREHLKASALLGRVRRRLLAVRGDLRLRRRRALCPPHEKVAEFLLLGPVGHLAHEDQVLWVEAFRRWRQRAVGALPPTHHLTDRVVVGHRLEVRRSESQQHLGRRC